MPREPRRKGDEAWLWDMLQASREAALFVRDRSQPDFDHDLLLRRAVERVVEIIGEAARKVSEPFKDAHPEIPWRAITAQRHILAHDYDLVDDQKVWRVATIYVPVLIEQLTPLVPTPPVHPDDQR
jgi:uncharacterized protein with HEPN domain